MNAIFFKKRMAVLQMAPLVSIGCAPLKSLLRTGLSVLINCIGGPKIYLHDAVVATHAKRINGKGFGAKPGEAIFHQTVRKQADITVRPMSDIGEPFYVDVTVI